MTNIIKITAEENRKRNGELKGYKYIAHFADGSTAVARANATRLYANAFQYKDKVNFSGKSGLAPFFCFGKKAPYEGCEKTYPIEPI